MWRAYPGEVSSLTTSASFGGHVDSAFAAVKDAFLNNFIEHGEIGASVAISINGVLVVDQWGGHADPQRTRQWSRDQLVNVFSVGKGVTSLLVAQCVDRGLLRYTDPVTDWWPEFGSHGKEKLTVEDLLGHRAGLPAVRHRLPPGAMYDWALMTSSLAAEKPWWDLGSIHGYHVNTFGFLVGEVLRRATSRTVGELVNEWIAAPVGAEIFLGVPAHLHDRIADFEWPGEPASEQEPPDLSTEQLMQYNTYYNPGGLSGSGSVNTPQWRQAEIPSTNMHATAVGICQMYTIQSHGGHLGSVGLISGEALSASIAEVSNGNDEVLGRNSRFGRGFQLPLPERGFGPNAEAFGHFGAGGSVGFCDPAAKVGFGYVMNQMGPRWQNPRNRALIDSLYSCL